MKEKLLALAVFAGVLGLLLAADPFVSFAFAGTGGTELNSWWTELSDALKGTWGKLIAAAFIGLAIITGKSGGIIPAIFLFLIGISIGTIPDIVDARYTATF